MRAGRANRARPDFKGVKTAFERHYECLGIACLDVGGLENTEIGGYFEGAEPCEDINPTINTGGGNEKSSEGGDGPNAVAAIGWTVGFVALSLIAGVVVARRSAGDKEFDGPSDPDDDSDAGAEVVSFEDPQLWREPSGNNHYLDT